MSYFRKGDPLDDFMWKDMEQARYEARLPICEDCNERITDDDYYEVDGEILCEDCMKERYQKSTDDYAQGYL
jgi:formylmethanofuran dehydrogenase subunit E